MDKNTKYKFLSKLEQLAEDLYRRGDSINHDETWERQKSFLWGYGDAGKTINLVTSKDIQQVIDRAHGRVYGESRVSRTERLKPIKGESGERDWDAFDSPTYERKSNSE